MKMYKILSLVARETSYELDLCPHCTTCIFCLNYMENCLIALIPHLLISIIDILVSLVYYDDPFLKICLCFFCHGTLDQSMPF